LDLNEGPEFLSHGDQTFIIYSTRESWLEDYRLGQLRLKSSESDPMDSSSWLKTGPVFTGSATVYGVGHASFTTSPDSLEDWIVYHSKVDARPWQFQFDAPDSGEARGWFRGPLPEPRQILVPFPWGSPLSGVPDSAVIAWYARSIIVPAAWAGRRVFFVIGAADWRTTAWLDGQKRGTHDGG